MMMMIMMINITLCSGGAVQAAGWFPAGPAGQAGHGGEQPDTSEAQPQQHPGQCRQPGLQAPGSQ